MHSPEEDAAQARWLAEWDAHRRSKPSLWLWLYQKICRNMPQRAKKKEA